MANWSRRRSKAFKGTKARSTVTLTFGKGITRSSSTKLGTKRTTRTTSPNNKQTITETYNVNGATKRSVRTLGPAKTRNVDNLFKMPKRKKLKGSGYTSSSSGSSLADSYDNDGFSFFWPIVLGIVLITMLNIF